MTTDSLYRHCAAVTVCSTSDIKHRLRVFENRVLREIFGAKREEGTCDWRNIQQLYVLPKECI